MGQLMQLTRIIQVDPHDAFVNGGFIHHLAAGLAWNKDEGDVDFHLLVGISVIVLLSKGDSRRAKEEAKGQETKNEQALSHKFTPFVRIKLFLWLATGSMIGKA
jgi:hypothetical protein